MGTAGRLLNQPPLTANAALGAAGLLVDLYMAASGHGFGDLGGLQLLWCPHVLPQVSLQVATDLGGLFMEVCKTDYTL